VAVDEVVRVVDEPPVALLARAERRVGAALARVARPHGVHDEPRDERAEAEQRHGRPDDENEEDAREHPRAFAERGREAVLERRHAGVDRGDLPPDLPERARRRLALGEHGTEAAGDGGQSDELAIGGPPELDRARDVRRAAQAAEDHGHRVDVVGMVASRDQALGDDVRIGMRALELAARAAIAERDRDERLEADERASVAVGRLVERVDGRLLRLRPEALAADVGPHARHRAERRRDEHEQAEHGEREERDDQAELTRESQSTEKPLER
jgi:hypothetical protein